jgi:aryl carrier-like protein
MTRLEPDLDDSAPTGETDSGLASDDVRVALSEAWSELLGVDEVTPSSNFYSAGGTSVVALLLLAKMHGKGSGANLSELIARPTFAEQVELFTTGRAEVADTREVRLNPTQELRLAQIARQVKAGETVSLKPLPLVVEIVGEIDRHLLMQSMVDLVRRHENLSTGFLDSHGEIAPARTAMADTWKPEEIDFSAFSRERALDEIWRLIAETADQGLAFDITPLILGAVVTIRPDLTFAVLVVDHLVCDGESVGILYEDLVEIYSAKAEGRPPKLPDLSTSARDALAGTDRYSADDWPVLAAKWRDLLDGYPAPPAFDLLGEIGARDYSLTVPSLGRPTRFVVPAGTVANLKATYRRLGVPPLAVMLGATYLAAHIISGARDICIINPRSRRNAVGEMQAVNDFAEPAVIRIRHQGASCPCDLTMAEVATMAATSHSRASELEMPIDMIRPFSDDTLSSTARSMIGSTLCAVAHDGASGWATAADGQVDDEALPWLWCNYNRTGSGSRSMGDAVATSLESSVDEMYPVPNLMIYIYDNDEEIQVEIVVPEKLYESQLISELGSTLGRVLSRFAENPRERVSASGSMSCTSYGVEKGRGM